MKKIACLAIILMLASSAHAQSRAAADMYRIATRNVSVVASDSERFILSNVFDAPLDDSVRAIVDRNADALQGFETASQVPFGTWGFDPDDTLYAGKTLSNAQEITDFVVLRARLRASSGQYALALEDCYNIALLARRFSVQPSLPRQMLQNSLFDKALSTAGLMLPDAPPADVQKFLGRIEELRAPADPIDVSLAQKQVYLWLYRKVVTEPDIRNKLDNGVNSLGEIFGLKSDPVDVKDLIADPNVADQVLADTEIAFNQMISALKLPASDRTEAVQALVRRLRSAHPLVRGAVQMVNRAYQLSQVQPIQVELFRTAARIYAELPKPIDENSARKLAGVYQFASAPGGFELIGGFQGADQPVVIRVGQRPIRQRPTTIPGR